MKNNNQKTTTMNFKTMLIALFSAIVLFSSCKKDNPVIPEPIPLSAIGEWEGTYYFNYVVNKDGTFYTKTVEDGAYSGSGTWTMSGDAFKATYTYKNVEYKNFISAKVNDKGDSMTGTYSGETEGNVLGSITMKKK